MKHLTGVLSTGVMLMALSSVVSADAQQGSGQQAGEQEEPHPLVAACLKQAMRSEAGHVFEGKPLEETNIQSYEKGEPYDLRVNLLGHGNTFYNIDCQVDAEGDVKYQGYSQTGQPQTS